MEAEQAAKRGRIKFDAKLLPMLFQFTAPNDIRYYLAGINFEPAPGGGVFAAATNGHMLCAVHDPEGECEVPRTIRINREALKFCKKQPKKADPILIVEEGRALIVTEGLPDPGELYVQARDCRIKCGKNPADDFDSTDGFPKWRRVLVNPEKLKPGTPGWFNVDYIRQIATVAPKTGRFGAMRFWSLFDPTGVGPTVVTFESQHNIAILVMPMHALDVDAIANNAVLQQWPKPAPSEGGEGGAA